MKRLHQLQLYYKILVYSEGVSLTLMVILPLVLLFMPVFQLFLIWFAAVGAHILVDVIGDRITSELAEVAVEEFRNSLIIKF